MEENENLMYQQSRILRFGVFWMTFASGESNETTMTSFLQRNELLIFKHLELWTVNLYFGIYIFFSLYLSNHSQSIRSGRWCFWSKTKSNAVSNSKKLQFNILIQIWEVAFWFIWVIHPPVVSCERRWYEKWIGHLNKDERHPRRKSRLEVIRMLSYKKGLIWIHFLFTWVWYIILIG